MSKAEKILDKVLGILFFLAFISLVIWGALTLSAQTSKLKAPKETTQQNIRVECVRCGKINPVILFGSGSIPDSISIECYYCKCLNTRSLLQFNDTLNRNN